MDHKFKTEEGPQEKRKILKNTPKWDPVKVDPVRDIYSSKLPCFPDGFEGYNGDFTGCPPLEGIVDAPVFHPTEEEFGDPMKYFHSIYNEAEQFGICKIVPPKCWTPPVNLEPDTFSFFPRIQRLRLLEAHQRIWHCFYSRLSDFWSMHLLKIQYPIIVKNQEVELSHLHYRVFEELKIVNGDLSQVGVESWKTVASALGYKVFDVKLLQDLSHVYKTLLAPMQEFSDLVLDEIKRHGQLYDREVKGGVAPKKRRMMAGTGARRSMKKMMKTSTSGYNLGESTFIFDTFNTCRVDLASEMCRKCGLLEREKKYKLISCVSCYCTFHKDCIDDFEGLEKDSFISVAKTESYKCRGCVAYGVANDPLLTFGFKDHVEKFTLADFENYADFFKKLYFKVNHSFDVSERIVEKEFWKRVVIADEDITVLYGADLHSAEHGSGFPSCDNDDSDCSVPTMSAEHDAAEYGINGWNLNNFPMLPSSILRHIGSDVSGMTRPWIYIGMMFSAFCWHTEDHWTPSINYLHFGEPKTWYGIPGHQAGKFDQRVQDYAPLLFQLQPDILHQLNTMIHPHELVSNGIQVCRADQQAGEFMITFPRAYHAGFNQGFNCAEAVNFGTWKWLQHGFNSIEHYVSIKRNNVFSHEELLCSLAKDASSLELEEAEEAYLQLKILVEDEKELLSEVSRLNIRSKKCLNFEDIKEDDERCCFFCSRTLFFSGFTCACKAKLPPKLRKSCGKHFRSLCRCALAKRQFLYRYTLTELQSMESSLLDRISTLKRETDSSSQEEECHAS